MTLSFNDLLAKASANGGQSIDELEGEKVKLTVEIGELERQLAAFRVRLREVEALIAAPVKAAVKAAAALGIAVPDTYKAAAPKASTEGRKRTAGSYRWEPQPLPGSNPSEDLTAKEMELSRGLWAYSKGSGGSAGKGGEGVLTVGEFKELLQAQTGKTELEPGET
ncbi:MAG: hypothetical protein Q8P50_10455, partial [Bacillota bacterium]|nr:hypothetical protein [Bacillota bacterium]